MIREKAMENQQKNRGDFRWRGTAVSRIEGFSDAVFAFSITLLVVSLQVPATFNDLIITMKGFLAFAVCFAAVVMIWVIHYTFFRRYGLVDGVTITLNAILLFVVIFYIYPLKFLFNILISVLFFGNEMLPLTAEGSLIVPLDDISQWPTLMIIYSVGFVVIFLIFVLLYAHAWRKRKELELNVLEEFLTKSAIGAYMIEVVIGIISILIALTVPLKYVAWAGLVYWILGPLHWLYGAIRGKKYKQLKSELTEAAS